MLTQQQIKEALYACKDEVVIGLWNECAMGNRYEIVYKNGRAFFEHSLDSGWRECIEAMFAGEYRTRDKYAWFTSNNELVSFSNPRSISSPVDYDVLASFIHERYDLIAPSDLFDIEINNKED